MGVRFEFDSANHILLVRVEGRLSDGLLAECYEAIRKYSTATNANAAIFDMSAVTEFAVSSECIRRLVGQDPAMPHATTRLRIIAVDSQNQVFKRQSRATAKRHPYTLLCPAILAATHR